MTKNSTSFRLAFLFVLLCCESFSRISAQATSTGTAATSAVINFDQLARHYAAHPQPLVPKLMPEPEDEHRHRHHPHPPVAQVHFRQHNAFAPMRSAHAAQLPLSPNATDSFEATLDNGTSIPPDTHGAADSNYVVTAINTSVHIQTRAGGNVSTVSLDQFWTSVLPSGSTGVFDPRIHFDPFSGRWIMAALSDGQNANSSVLIGVSQTSNPTGNWNLYRVLVDATGTYWLDFPNIGVNNKWIVFSGNLFPNGTGSANGARLYVFNKANLVNGTGANYTVINKTTSFTICPSFNYDPNAPNIFAVESWNSTSGLLQLWKITGTASAPVMTSVGFPANSSGWQGSGPNSGVDFAPQSGTTNKVQTNDDRITNLMLRNGKLWCSHTCFLPATGTVTRSAIQWWQIDTLANPQQIGRIEDPTNTNFYAFPGLAVNKFDDALIGYSKFSAAIHPSAAYSLHMHTDPIDSMRPSHTYRAGQSAYYKKFSGTENRWGDYSAAVVDPTNDVDFWTIQEASSGTVNIWDTWWAHVHINICAPPPAPSSVTMPAIPCGGTSATYTVNSVANATSYTWTVSGSGWSLGSTTTTPAITLTAGSGAATISVTANDTCGSSTTFVFTAPVGVCCVGTSLPLVQGFEGATFPPTGWSISNPDNDSAWIRRSNAGGFALSTASAYYGNYNSNYAGTRDFLYTPILDFSHGLGASSKLKFDYAYAPYTGSNDSLLVLYSTDCGGTWSNLWAKGGTTLGTTAAATAYFVPTSTQWKRDSSISLASLAGQAQVQFAFVNVNRYGNNIYLDNVNIDTIARCTINTTLTTSICQSSSYAGHTASGTYTDHYTSAAGCDSARTLNLTVKPNVTSTVTASICQGLSYAGHTASGTYTDHYTSAAGCDSARTLNLTVTPNVTSTVTASICQGSSYVGHTASGTYTDHYTSAAGCDSARTLNLTVKPNVTSTVTASICQGSSYAGHTASGTYTDHYTSAAGCDSARTLNLTVTPNVTSTVTASICQGSSYAGHTASGTYTDHYTSAAGCDSARTLNLTVSPTMTASISASGSTTWCEGSSSSVDLTVNVTGGAAAFVYSWSPSAFISDTTTQVVTVNPNAVGTYTYTVMVTDAAGCFVTKTKNVIVKAAPHPVFPSINSDYCASVTSVALSASVSGGTFSGFGVVGSTFSPSAAGQGIYQVNYHVASNGCSSDTAITISVDSLPQVSISGNRSGYCSNDAPVTFVGSPAGGTWSGSGINANGVFDPSLVTISNNSSAAVTIAYSYTNALGCAGSTSITVVVTKSTSSSSTLNICASQLPYLWNGLTFTSAGTQTVHISNAQGCDSAATLALTVTPGVTSTFTTSICQGSSYAGHTVSGTYTDHYTSAAGCDSARTLTLTVTNNIATTVSQVICQGGSYAGHTSSGTYTDHYNSASGCDSARTLNLTVTPNVTSTVTTYICQGSSYAGHTVSGTYTDHYTSAAGCDSARTLILTVTNSIATTVSQVICQGGSYAGHTSSGTYTDHYTSASGCDSARTLNLTVTPNVTSSVTTSICQGSSYAGYTVSGTYTDHYTSASGCDSARTLTLTVTNRIATTVSQVICQGGSYAGHTSSGTYTDHYNSASGCDSARTLNLTVTPNVTSTVTTSICQGSSYAGHTVSGTYTDHYNSASGCDSARTLNLTVNPNVTSTVTTSICQGSSYAGHTVSGTYTDHYNSSAGCDSARTLILTLTNSIATTVSQVICQGGSYAGHTSSGTYTDHYTSASGCDSARTLNLTVTPNVTSTVTTSICQGSSYAGHTISGTYTDHYTSAAGCDSARTLTLTVTNNIATTVSQVICQGGSYAGHTSSGTYTDHYNSASGCDSARTLSLTVNPNVTSTVTTSICQGSSYAGHTVSGTYTDHYTSASGCDSARTLTLTITNNITTTVSQRICQGSSYAGHTSSGTYTDHYNSAGGCDSARTLTLTVNQPATQTVNATINSGQSYTVGTQSFTSSGTYNITIAGAAVTGCDSIVTLNLTVITCVTSVACSANTTNLSAGTSIVLTATSVNGGSSPSYNWYKNGAVVSGVHSAVLSYGGTLGSGDSIYCTLTSAACGTSQTVQSNVVYFTKSGSGTKDIVTFRMPNQVGTSVINTTTAVVNAIVTTPPALRTAIHPIQIVVSTNAGYAPSYYTNRDFSMPVTYTVAAQNGSTRVWTAIVVDQSGNKLDLDTSGTLSSELVIYPNPAYDVTNIKARGGIDVPVVTILDMQGRVMYHQALPAADYINHMVDVSAYAGGEYVVYVASGKEIMSKQLVIIK